MDPAAGEEGVYPARVSTDDEALSLLALPPDVWVCCLQHADIEAFASLPQTCTSICAAIGMPAVRLQALQGLVSASRARDGALPPARWRESEDGTYVMVESAATSGLTPTLQEALAARSHERRLRHLVRDMAGRAIRHRSIKALRQCVDSLGFDLVCEQSWVLRRVMLHDFADGVDYLLAEALEPEQIRLAYFGTPARMLPRPVQNAHSDAYVVPEAAGVDGAADTMKSVLRMSEVELPDFNAIFLGVLFHSVSALPRLIEVLRRPVNPAVPLVVQMTAPLAVERDPLGQHEPSDWCWHQRDERTEEVACHWYARQALGGEYVCCGGGVAAPQFIHAFAAQSFCRQGGGLDSEALNPLFSASLSHCVCCPPTGSS